MVRAMAGYGVPHDDIGRIVKCSPPTLRKRFRDELDLGNAEANAKVAQTLYQQATTPGNIAASIFWLKARAGWREKQIMEVTGKDGAALPALSLAIRYVSAEPLSELEWLEAYGDKSTAHEERRFLPSYKPGSG
jgi:hypothetical protein